MHYRVRRSRRLKECFHYKPTLLRISLAQWGTCSIDGQDDFKLGSLTGLGGEPDIATVSVDHDF